MLSLLVRGETINDQCLPVALRTAEHIQTTVDAQTSTPKLFG